jgi:hypothetical protein
MHPMSTRYPLNNRAFLIDQQRLLRSSTKPQINNVKSAASAAACVSSSAVTSGEGPPQFPEKANWADLKNNEGLKYELIKKYLKDLDVEDWKSPYLMLPNICFTEINGPRFHPHMNTERSFIRLINRNDIVTARIKDYENDLFKSLYLYGPLGCGKSFIIYHTACKLMCSNDNVVIYVNKASPTTITDILRLLKTRYYNDEVL